MGRLVFFSGVLKEEDENQTVLYYYLKLSGDAEMKYDTVPESVVEVNLFLSGEPQEDIEIPQENVHSI